MQAQAGASAVSSRGMGIVSCGKGHGRHEAPFQGRSLSFQGRSLSLRLWWLQANSYPSRIGEYAGIEPSGKTAELRRGIIVRGTSTIALTDSQELEVRRNGGGIGGRKNQPLDRHVARRFSGSWPLRDDRLGYGPARIKPYQSRFPVGPRRSSGSLLVIAIDAVFLLGRRGRFPFPFASPGDCVRKRLHLREAGSRLLAASWSRAVALGVEQHLGIMF